MVQEILRSLSLVSGRSFLTNISGGVGDDNNGVCDYDENPTSLFLLIEAKEWDNVKTRAKLFPNEAKTFVIRNDPNNRSLLKWRLLPLHLAILYSAPSDVIQTLLKAYKKGAECYDDENNLPIHLAVKKHADEDIMNMLLQANPKSIDIENGDKKTPLQMAQRSTSPYKRYYLKCLRRGPIYKTVTANMIDEFLCGVEIPILSSLIQTK